MQGGLGVEHGLYHGGRDVGVDYGAGGDYALGQVFVGEHYEGARVGLGHVLNGAYYALYYLFNVPHGHVGAGDAAPRARVEHVALYFDVEHGDDYHGEDEDEDEEGLRADIVREGTGDAQHNHRSAQKGYELAALVLFEHLEYQIEQEGERYELNGVSPVHALPHFLQLGAYCLPRIHACLP